MLSKSIVRSSAVLFAIRLFQRSIGLVSTLILARLLTPADYGVVAIASISVFLFEAMAQLGTGEYLVQKKALSDGDINTAWTLNLLSKFVFWVIFVAIVPLISAYYEKPELKPVLWVVSLILPIYAMGNVTGMELYRRELNYVPLLYLSAIEKIGAFLVMLLMLAVARNYWVMIVSMLSASIINCLGSYYFASHRPRFCVSQLKVQWDFSKWVLPQGAIGFIKSEFDSMVVSKFYGVVALGGFNLVKSLTLMVGRDVIQPATEPLLASFSRSRDDIQNMGFQFTMSLWLISLFVVPVVAFVYQFGDMIVFVLYGDQWLEFGSVLKYFSILMWSLSIGGVCVHLLTSLGKVRFLFLYELIAFGLIVCALLGVRFESIESFSLFRVMIAVALVVVLFIRVWVVIRFPVFRLLVLLPGVVVPVLLCLAMAAIMRSMIDMNIYVEFVLVGGAYVLAYSLCLCVVLFCYKGTIEGSYMLWLLKENLLPVLVRFRKWRII